MVTCVCATPAADSSWSQHMQGVVYAASCGVRVLWCHPQVGFAVIAEVWAFGLEEQAPARFACRPLAGSPGRVAAARLRGAIHLPEALKTC